MTILVTGATGTVGEQLLKQLDEQGAAVKAAVLSPDQAARLPALVPWTVFDFTNPATYPNAFAGVKRLFLMRPPHIANIERDMKPAIEFAEQAGVEQIVFLSLLGAEKNRFVPHAKVETVLAEGKVPFTLLRCGFFMQNLSGAHRAEIRDQDELFIPAGRGKTAFIDVRDIAAVAAKTLTEPGHFGQAYALTGPHAVGYAEVARQLSQTLGRPIAYRNPSLLRFAVRQWRSGKPLAYAAVVSAIYLTTRLGMAAQVTNDVEHLLGRPPRSMKQFLNDYQDVWQTAVSQPAVQPPTA